MSIEYRVSVEIPEGIIELFGRDDEFIMLKNDALFNSSMNDIDTINGYMFAEFDDLDDAKECNRKLNELFEQFSEKRATMIATINKIQESISDLVSGTSYEMIQTLFNQYNDGEISSSLRNFLVDEVIAWEKLTLTSTK